MKEGPEVYVERIDITGNLRTQDRVVRREFRLVEGDAFNTTKLKRSEQRINNLGFFKKVDITNTPGSSPDKTIIHVNVQEQSTGEFQVGVGYSTSDGPLANIGIHERNLLGKGQDLRLDTTIAYRTRQVDLSFTEPYFLNRELAAGFDIFALQRDYTQFAGYIETSYGASLRAGYQFNEALRQTLSYTIRSDTVSDIVDGCVALHRRAARHALGLDRRPGAALRQARQPLAADLGLLRFLQHRSRRSRRPGLLPAQRRQWRLLLSVRAELDRAASPARPAISIGLGQGVRIEDRYFVGGDNLRGFASGGIGPRDITTNNALGANAYWLGSLQLTMPLGLPKEFGLLGHVFTDFGSAWGFDTNTAPPNTDVVKDINSIRVSAGYGFSWQSPLGPLRLDLAVPIIKENFDKKEFFRVGFGSNF